jgi:hypothetical protein
MSKATKNIFIGVAVSLAAMSIFEFVIKPKLSEMNNAN